MHNRSRSNKSNGSRNLLLPPLLPPHSSHCYCAYHTLYALVGVVLGATMGAVVGAVVRAVMRAVEEVEAVI
jgi:hypothetical protein